MHQQVRRPLNDDDGCGQQASPVRAQPSSPPRPSPQQLERVLPLPEQGSQLQGSPELPKQTQRLCCEPVRVCCGDHHRHHRRHCDDRGEPDGHPAQHRHGPGKQASLRGRAAPSKGSAAPPGVRGACVGRDPPQPHAAHPSNPLQEPCHPCSGTTASSGSRAPS